MTDRQFAGEIRPGDDHLARARPGAGGALRAPLPGLAGGLPAHRPARRCSPATRRSSTSSTRWSTSTRSGSRSAGEIAWRRPIASLNYLLTSHVWRQDHNGFSHQDPGFIDHVVNKKSGDRARLPAAGREHPARHDRPLPAQPGLGQRRGGGQAPRPAVARPRRGARPRASAASGCGTGRATTAARSPTSCWPAAATSRRSRRWRRSRCCASTCRELRVRVVNVVDLMRLQDPRRAPARAVRPRVRRLFPPDKPVDLRLPRLPVADPPADLPPRATTTNMHVRGYKEEGTTTTPFDMLMLNDLDRFHLVTDVIDRVPGLRCAARRAAPADGRRAAALPRPTPARPARTRRTCADWTWSP